MSIKQMSLSKFFSNLFKNVPYHAKNEFSRHNLIDNGSFMINERGAANPITFPKVIPSLATGNFIADRWEISGDILNGYVADRCNRETENPPNTALSMTYRNLNTTRAALRQYVYIPALEMRNRSYTVSFLIHVTKPIKMFITKAHTDLTVTPRMIDYGVVSSPTIEITADNTNKWQKIEWTIRKEHNSGSTDPLVVGSANAFSTLTLTYSADHSEEVTVVVTAVKMEEGEYATKFEELGYSEEMSRCQSLFYYSPYNVRGRTPPVVNYNVITVNELPTTMKYPPTVSSLNLSLEGTGTTSNIILVGKRNLVQVQFFINNNNISAGCAFYYSFLADAEQWRLS